MKRLLNVLVAILLAALLAVWAMPAMAEEGQAPFAEDIEPSGDEEPPADDPPDEPEPPVTDDPGSEPGGEDPTPEPGDDDPSSEPGSDDPTPEPGDDDPTAEPGDDDPTPEPTDEPGYTEPGDNDNNNWGGDSGGSTSSRVPSETIGGGSDIAQPSFAPSIRSTPAPVGIVTPTPSGPLEPRYMTFARLTQKTNSMSVVLFYSGAACVGVGFLGLLVLVIFIARGRRTDERDEIFQEIEQAEIRRPVQPRRAAQLERQAQPLEPEPQQYDRSYAQGYESQQPSVYRPEPEELAMPVNGSLYTEEFEIPQQALQPEYVPEPEPASYDAPSVPSQAHMYTEEFELPARQLPPDEMEQAPQQYGQRVQPSRQAPRQAPALPARDDSYDTTEILREVLYGNERDDRRQ